MTDIAEDTPTTGQKFAAETLGTFVLVFFGCGAAVYSGGDLVATALTFGITVIVMAYAVGRISGGHFNPAVSLGAALGGRLPWNQAGLYMAAQLVGALLAGAALFGIGHGFDGFDAEGNMGQNFFGDQHPGAHYALWAALVVEIVLTAVFLWVILAVTDDRNEAVAGFAPLAIGLALTMVHFVGINLTGTSVNPARSIGVGVFAGTDAIIQLWLFVVGPFLGAAIAGLTYPMLFGQGAAPVAGSGLNFGGGGSRKNQPAPGSYEAQWNQGQHAAWGQQGGSWGQAPQQSGQPGQWGAQPPAQGQPDPYAAPQQPGQWGQPSQQQPGQWGAPPPPAQAPGQAPSQAPGQAAPGHWGNPEGDDDGRTQVRRPD